MPQHPVAIEYRQRPDGGYDLYALNNLFGDATVDLDLTLQNMVAENYARTFVMPAREAKRVARLVPGYGNSSWKYTYAYPLGRNDERAQDVVYLLPYSPQVTVLCGQGYFGTFSHQTVHALDFNMKQGTTVRAARGGVVADVEARYSEGGAQPSYRNKANYVKIQHEDGTIASYYHLQYGGVLVNPGQRVAAGAPIGLSGATGFADGPHLHFEVHQVVDGHQTRTLPTRFKTTRGVENGAGMQRGKTYPAL